MKASKFTDAQRAFIIKQGEDGVPVAEIFRKAGISHAKVFQLQEQICRDADAADETAELLEDENGRLKRIVADLSLGKKMLQEVLSEMYSPPR